MLKCQKNFCVHNWKIILYIRIIPSSSIINIDTKLNEKKKNERKCEVYISFFLQRISNIKTLLIPKQVK